MAIYDPIKTKTQRITSPEINFKGEVVPISTAPANVSKVPVKAPNEYTPWESNSLLEKQATLIDGKKNKLKEYEGYFTELQKLDGMDATIRKVVTKAINSKYGITDEKSYNDFVDKYRNLAKETSNLIDKYNVGVKNEEVRYNAWTSSLRPYGEVEADIEATEKKIKKLKKEKRDSAEANGVYVTESRTDLMPTGPKLTLTEEGQKLSNEFAAKIEAEEKRLALLKQEKADSQEHYYSSLSKNADFKEKSKHTEKAYDTLNTPIRVYDGIEGSLEEYADKNERAIISYLYNTLGEDAVYDYYVYMSNTWAKRKANEKITKTEALPPVIEQISKAGQAFGSGVEQWGQGVYSVLTGKETTPTARQYAVGKYIEDTNGVGKVVYGLSQTVGNMAPSILLSTVTGNVLGGTIGTVVGGAVGNVSMGLSASGNAYSEALKNGASKEQAFTYGTLIGISEVALGSMLGGITKLGGGKLPAKIIAKINAIDKAWLSVGAKVVINQTKEGVEEAIQTMLEPIFSTMVLGEEYTPAQLEDVLYSATLGFLSAGLFESVEANSVYTHAPLDEKVIDYYVKAGEKASEGSFMRGISDQIKETLAKNPDAKFTGFEIGRMAKYYKNRNVSSTAIEKSNKGQLLNTKENSFSQPTSEASLDRNATIGSISQTNEESLSSTDSYSIQSFSDGTKFVQVDTDQDIFENLEKKQQIELATKILKERFQGKVIGTKNKAFVNGNTVDEYTHPSKHLKDDAIYEAKLRASTELDNLLDAGFNFRRENDGKYGHTHPDAIDFSYFDVVFKVGNEYFKGVINIKNNSKGKLLKDVTKIENVTKDMTSRYGENPSYAFQDNVFDNSISQTNEKSQEIKYEMPTVSRDGIEIRSENDPEIQERLANTRDDIERTGILSGASDTTIRIARRLSKVFKVNILFEVSPVRIVGDEKYFENGRYSPEEKTIYINMGSDKSPLVQVISHEFIHSIEGTGLYNRLERYARKFYNKKKGQGGFDTEATKILDEYHEAGKTKYTLAKAQAEVVANYVSTELLSNEENIQRFVAEEHSLAEILRGIIDTVLSVVGNAKAKAEAQTRVKLRRASKLLNEALQSRNTRASTENTIRNKYQELQRQLNDSKITEESFDTQLEQLDEEASAMGIDLQEIISSFSKSDNNSYSIVALENGNVYVKASRNVIQGTTKAEQRKNITDFFNDLLNEKTSLDIHTIEGDVLTITNDTATKARDDYKEVKGQRIKLSDEEFAVKTRAEAHIDEIAETSVKNQKNRKDSKNHPFAKDGFTYRRAYFEDFDGQYYEVTLSVGHNGTVATVYNIGKIQESVSPSAKIIAVVGSKPLSKTLSNTIIRNPEEKSTGNLSLSLNTPNASAESTGSNRLNSNDSDSFSITAEKTAEKIVEEKKDNAPIANKTKIVANMSEEERYEVLKDKKIVNIPSVSHIPRKILDSINNQTVILKSWEEINKYFGSKKRTLIQKIASEFGIFKDYNNSDINVEFEFSNNNFRESYSKQGKNYENFAKMFSVFDKVIENAIGVEIHNRNVKGYKTDNTLNNVYVLLGSFVDGDYIYPVKLEIKEFIDKPNKLYVAITLNGIKKTEVWKQGTTENGVAQNSRSVDISIQDIVRNVNIKDTNFLKYIPNQFLNNKQIEAKNQALEEERQKHTKNIDTSTDKKSSDSFSITAEKTAEKIVEENKDNAPIANQLPRDTFGKLKVTEKALRKAIGDVYQIRYARVDELQPAIRGLTEKYLKTGKITSEDVKELIDYVRDTFGIESSREDVNRVRYQLNDSIKNSLHFIRDHYEQLSKKANAQPEWVQKTREERAKHFTDKKIREFRNWAMEEFNIPNSQKSAFETYLKGLIETVENANVPDSVFNSLFDFLYQNGMVTDDKLKRQYPDVYSYLKENKFTIDDGIKAFLPGYDSYKDFREDAQGYINLGKDGVTVSEAYERLSSIAPQLFPESIEDDAFRAVRILEVAQELKPIKKWAFENASSEEESRLKGELERQISNLARDITVAINYAQGTATVTQEAEIEHSDVDVNELGDLMEELKRERRKANSARSKTILSKADEWALRSLLDGNITLDQLDDKHNKQDIQAVYEATAEYEKLKGIVEEQKRIIRERSYERARKYLGDGDVLSGFRDHNHGFLYMVNPMERNFRYIGYRGALSERLIDAYIKPIKKANKEAILYKNSIVRKIEALDLSRKVKEGNQYSEAYAVQFVGEAESNIKYLKKLNDSRATRDGHTLDEWQEMLRNFWLVNPELDREKIHNAVDTFRDVYNSLFRRMNEARVRNGYEPISYRQGYFPHFSPKESNDILALFGKALGINVEFSGLPTDINGITQNFRPGMTYFAHANERLGFETVFDALEGLHRYLDSAVDVIYQTDNIVNLRALAQQIRYQASDEGLREREDRVRANNQIDETERAALLDKLHADGRYTLANFVNNLEEYTNILAGKKSKWDRGAESLLGRSIYQWAKTVSGKVAANLIAWNVGSWLTNFIPLIQGATGLETEYLLRGMGEAMTNLWQADGFESQSTWLTTRRGSESLLKSYELYSAPNTKLGKKLEGTALQKAGKAIGTALDKTAEWGIVPMEAIDMYVSNALVRGRYHQNIAKGMDSETAIEEADSWVAGVMADRTKSGLPTVFGATNPLIKTITQFQVEVANQIGFLFSDVPRDLRDKEAKAIVLAIIKYIIGAYLYNELYELLTGRRPALDPMGIINDSIGDFTGKKFRNPVDAVFALAKGEDVMKDTYKMPVGEAAWAFVGETLEQLPFISGLIGGGRIPISSALPSAQNIVETLGKDGAVKKITKELVKPLTYAILPGGGGQISKVAKGIEAVSRGGKYTTDSKGREILQYPIVPGAWTYIQGALFGPTSTKGGQEWVSNNFSSSLSWEQTKAYNTMVDEGMSQDVAYDVIDSIRNAQNKKAERVKVLNDADIPNHVKREVYKVMFLTDKASLGLKALESVGNYEDAVLDFMMEHPEVNSKEEVIEALGDKIINGRIINRNKKYTVREKAAIIQIIADCKNNPYWKKLENVYYELHPDSKKK